MLTIGEWYEGLDNEKERDRVLSIINNGESYLGKDIKNIFNKYIEWVNPIYRESKIVDFCRDYINGIAFYPLSDNVYYFIYEKNGTLIAKRDGVKSPKRKSKSV